MKLSIIIPIYNAGKTLTRCVDSILAQQFRDYELFLVDDGSTDDSPDICDRLKSENQRIRVIHKKNGGLSDARNAALEKAHGEYITFVDADDTIGEDTYKQLMTILDVHHEYDILEYPVYKFYGSKQQNLLQFHNRTYTDMDDYWLKGEAYAHAYAWNKIYKRELFRGVRFPVGRVFEDVYTLPLLLEKAGMVATTEVGMYYYHLNNKGITRNATGTQLGMLLDAHLKIMAGLYKRRRFSLRYYAHVLNIQLTVCSQTGLPPTLPPIPEWAEHEPLNDNRQKIKLLALKVLGINTLCRLYNLVCRILPTH